MLKTKINTRKNLLKNLRQSKLALSHREAIKVARELKYNYIWIDALCIVQDDTNDWERQSLLVPEIYANADLTLIAARSDDSRNGFLWPTYVPKAEPVQLPYQLANPPEQDKCYISLERNYEYGPTSQRAWCFQEEFVSRRILTYGEQQLSFRCRERKNFEDGGLQLVKKVNDEDTLSRVGGHDLPIDIFARFARKTSAVGNERDKILQCWYFTAEEFSTRSLYDSTDNHAALFGVVLKFQEALRMALNLEPTRIRYIAGLWETDMANGLLWAKDPASSALPVRRNKKGKNESVKRAPSWSWMALDGPVYQKDVNGWQGRKGTSNAHGDVQCCTPVDPNSWSPTPDGWGPSMINYKKFPTELKLEVNAYIREVRISENDASNSPQDSGHMVMRPHIPELASNKFKVLLEPAESPALQKAPTASTLDERILDRSIAALGQFDIDRAPKPSKIWAMRVRTNLGLLLEQISDPSTQPSVFQRLGVFAIIGNSAFYPKGSVEPAAMSPIWTRLTKTKYPRNTLCLSSDPPLYFIDC